MEQEIQKKVIEFTKRNKDRMAEDIVQTELFWCFIILSLLMF
jgi:hypothetical protein